MKRPKKETAQTWDSFEITLRIALEILKPQRCFEWGPGKSTRIMLEYPSVKTIDSVEHDGAWFSRAQSYVRSNKVNMIFEPKQEIYPFVSGRFEKYDLIFIDGIKREDCLRFAPMIASKRHAVILHDAEREEYMQAMSGYNFIMLCDDGHTACLTNDSESFSDLKVLLRSRANVKS